MRLNGLDYRVGYSGRLFPYTAAGRIKERPVGG